MGTQDQISRPNDRVRTKVVGHRETHYRGEPLSRREIRQLDEYIPLRPPHKIMNQSLYGKMDKS
jgi:hypothetical protein